MQMSISTIKPRKLDSDAIFAYAALVLSFAEVMLAADLMHNIIHDENSRNSKIFLVYFIYEIMFVRMTCIGTTLFIRWNFICVEWKDLSKKLLETALWGFAILLSAVCSFVHLRNYLFLSSLKGCVDSTLQHIAGDSAFYFKTYMCELEHVTDYSCSCLTESLECYSYKNINDDVCMNLVNSFPAETLWSLVFSGTCMLTSIYVLFANVLEIQTTVNEARAKKDLPRSNKGFKYATGMLMVLSGIIIYFFKKSSSQSMEAPYRRELLYEGMHGNRPSQLSSKQQAKLEGLPKTHSAQNSHFHAFYVIIVPLLTMVILSVLILIYFPASREAIKRRLMQPFGVMSPEAKKRCSEEEDEGEDTIAILRKQQQRCQEEKNGPTMYQANVKPVDSVTPLVTNMERYSIPMDSSLAGTPLSRTAGRGGVGGGVGGRGGGGGGGLATGLRSSSRLAAKGGLGASSSIDGSSPSKGRRNLSMGMGGDGMGGVDRVTTMDELQRLNMGKLTKSKDSKDGAPQSWFGSI